jgi:hypothetical protein
MGVNTGRIDSAVTEGICEILTARIVSGVGLQRMHIELLVALMIAFFCLLLHVTECF